LQYKEINKNSSPFFSCICICFVLIWVVLTLNDQMLIFYYWTKWKALHIYIYRLSGSVQALQKITSNPIIKLHLNFARKLRLGQRKRQRRGQHLWEEGDQQGLDLIYQKSDCSKSPSKELYLRWINNDFDDVQRAVGLLSFLIKTICLKSEVPTTKFC
jgi:hypothetical protein